MTLPTFFSLVFFTVSCIYFFFGIFIFSLNIRSILNRLFLYACLTICIWAFAFSIANSAPDQATALLWRRISAFGWGPFYSVLLHFTLILTEKRNIIRRKWIVALIYLPALINVFVFGAYSPIAVEQYDLVRIYSGWVNIARMTSWDILFQIQYVSFTALSIALIWFWGRSSTARAKKIQATLMIASYSATLILGTLTEFIINLLLPYKVPQLAPVFILFPMAAFFYCLRKYGFLAPQRKRRAAEAGQILSEVTRSQLFRYITQGYILAAFINFAALYFTGRQPLLPVISLSAVLLILGLVLAFIQYLHAQTALRDALSMFIITASIPLIMLWHLPYMPIYALTVPMIFVMMAVAFNQSLMLALIGTATFVTLAAVWMIRPVETLTLEPTDHAVRIVIFALYLWIAVFINRVYLRRLGENEEQMLLQKLGARISALFVTSNEKNIDGHIREMLQMCAWHFNLDNVFLILFAPQAGFENRRFEWNRAGAGAVSDLFADLKAADLARWMSVPALVRRGCIYIPDLAGLPGASAEKERLEERGIRSLLIIPLANDVQVFGFLGFDTQNSARMWPPEHQEVLNIIANRLTDIWLKVEAEKAVNYMAYYDSLTGLPNRALLDDRMQQAIALAERSEKFVAAAFIDIDNLKAINDTMGHDAGDDLLVQVARRLTSSLRKYDTVARFGGDEFIVMFPQMDSFRDVRRMGDKIIEAFRAPLIIKEQEFFITASVGIAIYPLDGETPDELVKSADLAMYHAKEKGKDRYTLCSTEMKVEFLTGMELSNHLYRALERGELALYYQPKVRAADGQISGVEALLRWFHPQRGLISPDVFIPIAEKNGLITPIGQWVLETACRQNKAWQEAGIPPIHMSVNLSLGQFLNKRLVAGVQRALDESGMPPALLELEITESIALHEPDYVIQTLNELRALGVQIAIDDFGTEYSSLSRLKTLPVDKIKIDVQFVRGIARGSKEEGIIRVILQLARTLGLETTAEGVETRPQLDFLRLAGCNEIQGYYFFRPMPPQEVEPVLRDLLTAPGGGFWEEDEYALR